MLVFPRKTPELTKMGEIHELFVLALSLVWFAGATPDQKRLPLGCFRVLTSDVLTSDVLTSGTFELWAVESSSSCKSL